MLTHTGTQTIKTERLILRRYTLSDAESMFRNYAQDTNVTRFLSWEPYQNVDGVKETLAHWQEDYNRPDFYHWAIEYQGEVIGGISAVEFDELNCSYELGYCLSYAFWNKGFMTEAAKSIIDYLFERVHMHRITAKHDVKNPSSGKVMQHIGMRYEGRYMGHYIRRDGEISDALVYAVLKDEWETQIFMEEKVMKNREEKAHELFLNGYNCAQSVLGVFCEERGLDINAAFKLANGFGGGMRCGETCGAVSGAMMVIGLKCGFYVKGDFAQKGFCHQKTYEFIEKFRNENGAVLCRDLLGTDIHTPDDLSKQEVQGLFKTVCPKMIACAVRILEEMDFER